MIIERISAAGIILLVCAVMSLVDARRRRDSESGDERGVLSAQSSARVNATYLDTLNAGAELFVRHSDLAVITSGASAESAKQPSAGRATVQGFRIQCFASNNIEAVRAQKSDAEGKTGLSAYIIFVEPYYKLLAGDFSSRADAEAALARVKAGGYPEAWIVSSPITARR